jgi:menaquinone-dependent protoporphyrinogen oxidase
MQVLRSVALDRREAASFLWGTSVAPMRPRRSWAMHRLAVVYATREGHTRRIAEHVAATMRSHGDTVDVIDAAHPPPGFDISGYGGFVLAASVHMGKHEREMAAFVKANLAALDRVVTAFLSVSLTEAGAEDRSAPFDRRARAAEQVKATVEAFCHETGLRPSRTWPVAGALLYHQYGFIKRLALKMIARREGGDTDTSRDYEYTDWEALDRFVGEVTAEMEQAAQAWRGPRAL